MTRVAGVLAIALLAACGQTPTSSEKVLVVASIYPVYEFSQQVAGDRARVVALVPPGVEPHDWEPSPQEVVEVQNARLFVYNGAGIEAWADKLIASGAGHGAIVNATEGIDLLGRDGSPDPHVWLDPVLAQTQVELIRRGLARVDATNAAAYADSARAFSAKLAALDQAFAAGLRDCVRRDVVTTHAAFQYLTRRYRLVQVPLMGLAPESEPSPAELAAIARVARQRQVQYVFFETLVSGRLAEALAREVGAKTLILNPIEGISRTDAAAGRGYIALMEANLQNLRTGLGCR